MQGLVGYGCHESFFSPCVRDFLDFETAESDEWYLSHVSLAGVAFGAFPWDLSNALDYDHCHYSCGFFLEYLRTLFKDFMEIGTAILMSTGLALALVLMRGWWEKLHELGSIFVWFYPNHYGWTGDRLVCDCFRCISADGLILAAYVYFDLWWRYGLRRWPSVGPCPSYLMW